VRAASVEDLLLVGRVARGAGVPVAVIGRGSNLLVADAGFDGVVVVLGEEFSWVRVDSPGGDAEVRVHIGGGTPLPVAARRLAAAGVSGFEWAVGVPGSIGGAVRMNAGGHGAEMVDALESADILSLRSGRLARVPAGSLGLHFRGSALAAHHVVVSARLRTTGIDDAAGQRTLDGIVAWRRENQPGGRNAGSVFVNPAPGDGSAGALIDAAGLRGFSVGGARVSEKHANFILNDGAASAADLERLIATVQDTVERQFGIRLVPEVRVIGEAA